MGGRAATDPESSCSRAHDQLRATCCWRAIARCTTVTARHREKAPGRNYCRSVDTRRIQGPPRGHSPSLGDPTGAQSSQSSTMPATLCKAMYFSAVMKVSPSRGSCTSRWHPHFSHASGSHWRGSELVVMPASSQPAAAYPFGRIGQLPGSWRDHRGAEPDDHRLERAERPGDTSAGRGICTSWHGGTNAETTMASARELRRWLGP